MGKMKELFIKDSEEMFHRKPLWEIEEEMKDQANLEERVFEVEKGDYKTIITYRFNKSGYPVSHTYRTIKRTI